MFSYSQRIEQPITQKGGQRYLIAMDTQTLLIVLLLVLLLGGGGFYWGGRGRRRR
jgi:hypothetical protein